MNSVKLLKTIEREARDRALRGTIWPNLVAQLSSINLTQIAIGNPPLSREEKREFIRERLLWATLNQINA